MNAPHELVDVGVLDRRTYLGGGDIAAVMGVSPYRTRLDVYLEKISEAPPAPPDPAKAKLFRRGKLLEPVILEMLREDYGIIVTGRNVRYVDPEHPFLAAEIDFEWHDGDGVIRNGEIKSVHHFGGWKWGETATDEIPVEYAAQSMYGLMISRRTLCQYGVLFGTDNLVPYHIERDEETIANMRAAAVAFWRDHVLARVPPAPQTLEDVQRLWPRPTRSEIAADGEILAAVTEHRKLGQAISIATARRKEVEFTIKEFMKDFECLTSGGAEIATLKAQSRTTIDEKGLLKAFPDAHRQFARRSEFRVLRHKGEKE